MIDLTIEHSIERKLSGAEPKGHTTYHHGYMLGDYCRAESSAVKYWEEQDWRDKAFRGTRYSYPLLPT